MKQATDRQQLNFQGQHTVHCPFRYSLQCISADNPFSVPVLAPQVHPFR